MKSFKNPLLLAATRNLARPAVLVALTLACSLALTVPERKPVQAANPAPVTVTNIPLSVQGTINAAQSGSWNVGITGNSAVNPLLVRDVENSARQPFAQSVLLTMGSAAINGTAGFDVPVGKAFIIEYVSAHAEVPLGQKLVIFEVIGSLSGTSGTKQFFVPVSAGADAFVDNFTVSAQTRLYADSNVGISAQRSALGSGVNITCAFTGYLVDLP